MSIPKVPKPPKKFSDNQGTHVFFLLEIGLMS